MSEFLGLSHVMTETYWATKCSKKLAGLLSEYNKKLNEKDSKIEGLTAENKRLWSVVHHLSGDLNAERLRHANEIGILRKVIDGHCAATIVYIPNLGHIAIHSVAGGSGEKLEPPKEEKGCHENGDARPVAETEDW